jgi:hypothetical protein
VLEQFQNTEHRPLAAILGSRMAFCLACNTSIAAGLRFRNYPKATASCSRQNSLNTYLLFSSGLMFILGY